MTLDRRTVLKGAGLLAAGGAGVALTRDSDSDPVAAPVAITAENVRDHGAAGDGSGDDTRAIQAALDAVPAGGGAVFFPPGDYPVSAPLAPGSQTLIFGCHSPRYHPVADPASACKVRATGSFSRRGADRTGRLGARSHHPQPRARRRRREGARRHPHAEPGRGRGRAGVDARERDDRRLRARNRGTGARVQPARVPHPLEHRVGHLRGRGQPLERLPRRELLRLLQPRRQPLLRRPRASRPRSSS